MVSQGSEPSTSRSGALVRRAVLALPALSVAVVAVTVLVVGKPRPVIGIRLRGGPTEGADVLSWRLEAVERLGAFERALPGRAVVVEGTVGSSSPSVWRGVLDADGAAAVILNPASAPVAGPVRVRVSFTGAEHVAISEFPVSVTKGSWVAGAHRRGGWVERASGGFVLRAAAERGAFAVPFAEPLWIEVRGTDHPAFDVAVTGEGAVIESVRDVPVVPGRRRALLRPLEHSASVAINVRAPDGATASLDLALAVVPGALTAALEQGTLTVRSPIVREQAYVAIVSDSERVAGGTVHLAPDGRGGAWGTLALPSLPENGALWAVVSTEPDLHSESVIGWPIRYVAEGDPPTTFDVPDVLVADSVGDAVKREARRVLMVRLCAASFAALALSLTALLVVRASRRARAGLETHLASAGSDSESTTRMVGSDGGSTWLVVAAVLCFALAAVLVFVFVLWR